MYAPMHEHACQRGISACTWLHGEAPDFEQRVDLTLRRRMQHDDTAADDAQRAAQHAKHVEPLIEHEVRQNRTAGSRESNLPIVYAAMRNRREIACLEISKRERTMAHSCGT